MSVKIGNVELGNGARCNEEVWADAGGVRILSREGDVLKQHEFAPAYSPVEARNFAALLVRGADECERMQARKAIEWQCANCGADNAGPVAAKGACLACGRKADPT